MPALRQFARLSSLDGVPDETTILNFRHMIEENDLAPSIFGSVVTHLRRKGLMLKEGTMVDAMIIEAPSSTKNASRERDPEMHQTKKGNDWSFGMKSHIGADVDSGLVHSVVVTAANESDVAQVAELLHGKETVVYGDGGYIGAQNHVDRKNIDGRIARRRSSVAKLARARGRVKALREEKRKAKVRAFVEHPFRIVKCVFGYLKVCFKGLAKNTAQVLTLFALTNLYMARKQLMPDTRNLRPQVG